MGITKLFRKNKEVEPAKMFSDYSHLLAIKPKERYVFHSDYFKIDNYYATILSFFAHTESTTGLYPFWGTTLIPRGLDSDIVTINLETISRETDEWIRSHQATAEGVTNMTANAQSESGTKTAKHRAAKAESDLEIIAQELANGASYLNVQFRIMVKAPTLEKLDVAVDIIERSYKDAFEKVLSIGSYTGEQKRELTNLFNDNKRKLGKGVHFTSTEYAGVYNLVTHGLEDPAGVYVGSMIGDINNSAVLFDPLSFKHHAVISTEQRDKRRGRAYLADMWGVKIAQSALLDNQRVVHIVLDSADLDTISPSYKASTYKIDMNSGDVNMFEMFGDVSDELSIFPSQMQKIILMAEQAYEATDSDRSIIRGSLEEIAKVFYVEKGMWYENAKENRDKIRIVGIAHNEIPKLEDFVMYLDMEYKALSQKTARDDEKLHALSVLSTTFRNLLSNNGDLFNTTTSDKIDGVKDGRRVIYDFSKLMYRGKGVAMAQLVNVISYAVQNLQERDIVIIHGCENVDKGIRDYMNLQFEKLYERGGKVVFLYNDITKTLNDVDFNHFDKADYTIFGNMTPALIDRYQNLLGHGIPDDLKSIIASNSDACGYIRRGVDNVVFVQDLKLVPSDVHISERQKRIKLLSIKERREGLA